MTAQGEGASSVRTGRLFRPPSSCPKYSRRRLPRPQPAHPRHFLRGAGVPRLHIAGQHGNRVKAERVGKSMLISLCCGDARTAGSSVGRRPFLVGSLLLLAMRPTGVLGAEAASSPKPVPTNWVLRDKDFQE
jgi:hypothetical protein